MSFEQRGFSGAVFASNEIESAESGDFQVFKAAKTPDGEISQHRASSIARTAQRMQLLFPRA